MARPNRFIAHVEREGNLEIVHVKNTGRCRELLVPGSIVYLEECSNPNRKTKYDLVAVEKGNLLINMDAQAPNQVFGEWALSGHFIPELTLLRPEVTYGKSRFDFYWEAGQLSTKRRGFVEIKGVTLEENGLALFPDAPTERGIKHLQELIACRREGYEAAICFVLQMENMQMFAPNDRTHPAFGAALRKAAAAGVHVMAMGCKVTPDCLSIACQVPIELGL